MALNEYAVGSAVRLPVQLRDPATREPVDPATLVVRVTAPDASHDDYTLAAAQVVKDSVGLYHVDVVPDAAGSWTYAARTTGPTHTTPDRKFTVLVGVFDA